MTRRLLATIASCSYLALCDPPGASVSVKVNVPPALATGIFSIPRELLVPPGFQIAVWARLTGARFMASAPNGDIFVSQPGGGTVYIFRPAANGIATRFSFATGLSAPHGIAFDQVNGVTYVYVAETNQIDRYVYNRGDTEAHERQIIVKGLPEGSLAGLNGSYAHPLKNIAIGPDHRIYVGIGSSCNVCESDAGADPARGSIYVYNPDGSGGRLFARGLRNPEGLAFVPGTDTLWSAVNNRDQLPYPYQDSSNQYGQVVTGYVDDHPPEPFTKVRDGGNYGWPFCNPTQGGPTGFDDMPFDLDLDTNKDGRVDCGTMDRVSRGLQAHSAPLQFTFAQRTTFPLIYRDGAILAFHGSWNRAVPTGYKVAFLPWDPRAGKPGAQVDLVSGFREIGARPAGVVLTLSGSLLISDDATGTIYELTYSAPVISGANGYPVVAPDSYASLYGNSLASSIASSGPPYPRVLGGISVNLIDSRGNTFQAGLSFVSPTQVNFVVPTGMSAGAAAVSIVSLGAINTVGTVQVQPTAPGLFSLDGTGTGTAAATAVDASGTSVPVYDCRPSVCQAVPIDVSGTAKYLALYGTGIRGSTGSVTAVIDGKAFPVAFAGAQSTFPGLDQVNVLLPSSLAGGGTIGIQVAVAGVLSNPVTVAVR